MIAIGEAARLSGVAIETIRYYERERIISKARRTASGRRFYSETEIAELKFIKSCRDLGFSLQEAVVLREMANETDSTCASVEEIGKQHLAKVKGKIFELLQLEAALTELIANCSEGRKDCPMLTALMLRKS